MSEEKNGKVTLQDIASLAGVSRGTVDRVLKDRPHVRPEVRERVLKALSETGYLEKKGFAHALSSATGASPLRIGVIRPDWPGQFRSEVTRGIADAKDELAEFHVTVIEKLCESEVPQETVKLLRELEREGAAGISVCAPDDPAVAAEIDRLTGKGIPVLTYNSDIASSKRAAFIGQDTKKGGRIAAEVMSKCIMPGDTVVAAIGNREFTGHRERLDGFLERMMEKGFPRNSFHIIETFNDYRISFNKIASELQRDSGISAIYMANSSVTGCVNAVRSLGLGGKLRIVCHDLSEFKADALKKGDIDFVVTQDLYSQGNLPLRLLREHLQKGEPLTPPDQNSFIGLLCSENI